LTGDIFCDRFFFSEAKISKISFIKNTINFLSSSSKWKEQGYQTLRFMAIPSAHRKQSDGNQSARVSRQTAIARTPASCSLAIEAKIYFPNLWNFSLLHLRKTISQCLSKRNK
jgi:hypothetical protein